MELSLMIMDDNSYEREALRSCVNWSILGIEHIYLAENGKKGYELFCQVHPQIVLSDIKMPEMDGLAFVRKIRENHFRTRVIFLSAYDDFEYARQAMSQNAFRYLLKPVNTKELLETVRQAVDEVITQTLDEEDRTAFYGVLADAQDASREKYVKRFLLEEMEPAERGALYLSMNRICGLTFSPQMGVAVLRLRENAEYGYIESCLKALSKELPVAAHFTHGAGMAVLVLHQIKERPQALAEKTEAAFSHLPAREDLSLGVSDLTDNALDLPACYACALERASACERHGYGRCFFAWEQGEHPVASMTKQEESLLEEMEKSVRAGQFSEELLFEFADLYSRGADMTNLKSALIRFLSRFLHDSSVRWVCEGEEDLLSEETLYTSIIRGDSIPALMEIAREFLSGLSERFACQSLDKKQQIALEIKQIIDREYAEDITLKYLSGKVFLSSNYAHTLFKKIYGFTVNHYLTQVRIRKACELLTQTALSVSQIAERVGYEHGTYFFSIFKRVTGVSPNEYRRHAQKEQRT